VIGVLVPIRVYAALGVSDEMYHMFGILGGGAAGLMVVAGMAILLVRKWLVLRVRAHTGFGDYFAVSIVLLVSVLGTYITIVYDTTVVAYEYRATIGPWFRSLLALHPQYDLMVGVPFIFQLHVVVAFLLFASIPFTKLVHIFSLPIRYPTRAPIQYRSRRGYRRQPHRSK
jgi:nitrate reductase gamma subunit